MAINLIMLDGNTNNDVSTDEPNQGTTPHNKLDDY